MKRDSVSSSNLRSVGYDPETNILEVEFHGGRVYKYFNVPESEYQGLMNAQSHGEYHAEFVKEKYSYERIK